MQRYSNASSEGPVGAYVANMDVQACMRLQMILRPVVDCRLNVQMAFSRIVQVGVQREPRNQVQKTKQSRKLQRRWCKVTFGQSARTIPVQHARQAACPLPVGDDRKFAARAPPLRFCRSCRGAFLRMQGRWCSAGSKRQSCDDGGKGVLRGRHILDRRGASV